MAKKSTTTIATTPQWETRSRKHLGGGRLPGIDGSMWLYGVAPMSNIVDAKSALAAVRAGDPIANVIEELADQVNGRTPNRRMAKGKYRKIHIQLINVPRYFRAQPGTATEDYLNREFGHKVVMERLVLFGMKLRATTGTTSDLKSMIASAAETLAYGGSPLSDYDADFGEVRAIYERHGFLAPTDSQLRLANAWWNHGSAADTPVLPHADHLHFFRKVESVRAAEASGIETCEQWPDISGESAVTFAAVQDLDLRYTDAAVASSRWVPFMLEQGVRLISIRALVEPSSITSSELRAQKKRYRNDISEAFEKGKTDDAARQAMEEELSQLEASYQLGHAPATLVDTSIIVAIDGVVDDLSSISSPAVVLSGFVNRQAAAWHETMLCSSVNANPHLLDLPSSAIAYSGLPALSGAGDASGVLVGFSERDLQPVYLSPAAASEGDAFPIMLVAAGTGSGKTMLLLWMAHQMSLLGHPTVIIDPKTESDHSSSVTMSGGRVVSFDDLMGSDGVLDPMRFASSREVGVQNASAMLSNVNPWGSVAERQKHETIVAYALRYGADRGATGTGEALIIACNDGIISPEIIDPVFKFAASFPMFRATFGIYPSTESLNISNGITLFKVGRSSFKRPALDANLAESDPLTRCSVNALYQLTTGSMSSLSGREGVLHVDESWMLERQPDALEEIGRLARSQDVLPIFYTQTPSGPVRLGLAGYMSRGLIGHIRSDAEAMAALEIFDANTPALLRRVTATEFTTDFSVDGAPNWDSLKAMRHPETRAVDRGAVFYHSDLRGRIAPVEIVLPDSFLKLASTTPQDVAARRARLASEVA